MKNEKSDIKQAVEYLHEVCHERLTELEDGTFEVFDPQSGWDPEILSKKEVIKRWLHARKHKYQLHSHAVDEPKQALSEQEYEQE